MGSIAPGDPFILDLQIANEKVLNFRRGFVDTINGGNKRNTIWKFKLEYGLNKVIMPFGAEVLGVKFQGSVCCLWAIVTPVERREARVFHVFHTGDLIPDTPSFLFCGTAQKECEPMGHYVVHVFEDACYAEV